MSPVSPFQTDTEVTVCISLKNKLSLETSNLIRSNHNHIEKLELGSKQLIMLYSFLGDLFGDSQLKWCTSFECLYPQINIDN